MCGFVGFLKNKKADVDYSISEMMETIGHRGPDDSGIFSDDTIELGFQRLSIIDLEKGHQPLSDKSQRYWIVFNGEIYNYVEIRNELTNQGCSFQTNSDTEVILQLFMREKDRCVEKLEGMFSFVIWDSTEKILFGARDHFGIKPFYYLEDNNKFAFGSELKSLLPCLLENESLQTDTFQQYLSFQYIPEPHTPYSSIKKMKPGHFFYKKPYEEAVWTEYWHPTFQPVIQSEKGITEVIKESLRASVYKHMRSDVPVGCFLSGGIDSTIITALAKECHPNIQTFSVGFDVQGYSEVDIAEKTAEEFKIENIPYIIQPEEFTRELPKIVWLLDDIVADPSVVPLFFLAREARRHVKVALSGEGADELFGGYNIYREPQSLKGITSMPPIIKKCLLFLAKEMPDGMKGKNFLLRGCSNLEDRFIGNAKIFPEEEKPHLWRDYQPHINHQQITKEYYEKALGLGDVTTMQYVDIMTWLRGDILVKADRMSMANSLEVRVPFLDKQVFKIASSLLYSHKIYGKTTKAKLREAFREIVPSHVVDRKKLGFPVPLRVWFKEELYEWALGILDNSAVCHQYFHKEYVKKMLAEHRKGTKDNSRKIWTVLIFLIWQDIYEQKRKAINKKQFVDTVRNKQNEKEA
ncbi:asparagine synthase (glutamine-hydrolyzing) [Sutcliffiella rhizosphaerae]|uniref:asparagine synthase (glutamine-hydrolyzing) n=1 Tax=Sutcliffiella rhizosphaerae TaxID=2880967 RepID=A0ABM8YR99_9BACI|nr:asparagine synthase (glutamine-hydrolyzing) [Sutcliffiella rhizosphaerae]CAG9622439.1 Asparagine synthetase [glutamine-hydrolyzing] 1 [Sutcliffiella rhizosphaerae]